MDRTALRRDRRRFLQGGLALAGLGLLGGCGVLPPGAQQPKRVPSIGYLGGGNAPAAGSSLIYDAFVAGLRELGWVDRQTMALETRWAEARAERFPDLAAELIGLLVPCTATAGRWSSSPWRPSSCSARRGSSCTIPRPASDPRSWR